MSKIAKLNTDFDDYTEDEFYKAVKLIWNFLTTYILIFPGLPTAMTVLGPLIQTYDNLRTKPFYEGMGADISAARTAIQEVITSNGTWLNSFCKGVMTLLNKTGYPLAKDSVAQGKLPITVLTMTVMNIAGSIGFLISHIANQGIKYGIMYTTADNPELDPSKWNVFFYCAGKRDGIIPGLLSNVGYKFSSFGMGTSDDLTYSVPVILKAL